MTAIAAYKCNDMIWVACDTLAIEDNGFKCDCGTKLVDKGEYIIGVGQSLRVKALIEEGKGFPKYIQTIDHVRRLRDKVKQLLLADGANPYYSGDEYAVTHPFDILVVSGYGIWQLCSDYSIIAHDFYAAVGTGREVAIGTILAYNDFACSSRCGCGDGTWDHYGQKAVETAIDNAIEIVASVGGNIISRGFKCQG